MFDGFAEHEVQTGRGRSSPGSAATARRCSCCTATRRPTSCGTPRRRCWPSATRSSPRTCPATAASFRPAPDAGPRRRTPSGRSRVDLVEAMAALGHDRFAVAGHDRGGRVAYRMALDHPDRVRAARGPRRRAHRRGVGPRRRRDGARLLALGVPRPARAAARAPDRRPTPTRSSTSTSARSASAAHRAATPADLMAAYRALLDDPGTVQAICEDYRAGAGSTATTTTPTAARRRDRVPAARRCGARAARSALLRRRARRLAAVGPRRHRPGLDASHFLVEDQPEQVADLLSAFLAMRSAPSSRPLDPLGRRPT